MADLVWGQWYGTILRKESFAAEVAAVAPLVLRYGAKRYQVHVSNDDRYRITQMSWFDNKTDWYRYWDGPEMIEFRARNAGRFQIPITYVWNDEIAAGELGPPVPNGNGGINGEPATPAPAPGAPSAQ